MPEQEYSGTIVKVEASSAWVKVELDSLPGKTFAWPMTMFVSKPRPEVGKRIVCFARPGRLSDYDVSQIVTITSEVPVQAPVSTSLPTVLSTPLPTASSVAEPNSTIDQLAERILELKTKCKDSVAHSLLDFKWSVGQVISVARRATSEDSYRELADKTGIGFTDLARCVQFYEKFPTKGYELKAWRELRAELPEKAEAAEKPALVVDTKHLWVCPECNAKFEHVHVSENKHRLQECKAD